MAMDDQDIDLSEIPEVTEEQMRRAMLRVGGKQVAKGKIRVNIFLDADIVAYYKTLAGGRGYQTLINNALRTSILADDLETVLRRVIREELQTTVRHRMAVERADGETRQHLIAEETEYWNVRDTGESLEDERGHT